jgi:Reverse transcriptase (RNA-dependent DNA polymerase)
MACKPQEFKPISLINDIQKLFSKILACRLQPLMGRLLTETQIGFLIGISILYGFHFAREVIGAATKQEKQMVVFKADIHKAFDSIEWPFILRCLQASGFPERLINWIHFLVLQGSS